MWTIPSNLVGVVYGIVCVMVWCGVVWYDIRVEEEGEGVEGAAGWIKGKNKVHLVNEEGKGRVHPYLA